MGLPAGAFVVLQLWLALALVLPWLIPLTWLAAPPSAAEVAVFGAIAALTLATRVVATVQTGHGWTAGGLHPLTMALAILNGLWSLALVRRQVSVWKGRVRGAT
jgi:hypothetical protein